MFEVVIYICWSKSSWDRNLLEKANCPCVAVHFKRSTYGLSHIEGRQEKDFHCAKKKTSQELPTLSPTLEYVLIVMYCLV